VNKTGVWTLALTMSMALASCRDREQGADERFVSDALVSADSMECLKCHTKKQPATVMQWRGSTHATGGVGCYECHQAEGGEIDAYEHYGKMISTIISPKDCGECHTTQAEQFLGSHHAKGGEVLGSLDNYLGEVVEATGPQSRAASSATARR